MKTLKRKNILLASMLLGTVALSTVGFSAWVIVGGAEENVSGDISVDAVVDKSHEIIDFSWGAEIDGDAKLNSRIVFGSKAADSSLGLTNNAWLAYEQTTEKITVGSGDDAKEVTINYDEDLNAQFSFTVTNIETSVTDVSTTTDKNEKHESMIEIAKFKVSIGALEDVNGAYDAAATANYVGALPTPELKEVTAKDDGTVTFTYTITFTWGSYFNVTTGEGTSAKTFAVNPIDFFNSKGRTDKVSDATDAKTWAQEADAVLNGAVFQALKGEKYSMKIVVTA